MSYEYTVTPAPARGEKIRGAKTPADRYAVALAQALNAMATDGWEYVRAETLPSEERSGLTSRTTVWMNVLVFRRAVAPAQTAVAAPGPALVEQPQAAEPADPMRLTDPAAPPAPDPDSPRAV